MPPNAARPPASENGVEATAVPNTLAVGDAPNDAKFVTTFRGGDPGTTFVGEAGALTGVGRGGIEPYGE